MQAHIGLLYNVILVLIGVLKSRDFGGVANLILANFHFKLTYTTAHFSP
jgi:hypothetical protein